MAATSIASRPLSERRALLALICTAPFMVVLDTNIVTVALPAIRQDLGFSDQTLQWVISAYALPVGGFLVVGGRAGDLYGRRRMLRFGLGLFTVASIAAGLAPSAEVLVCARALQGLGAAAAFPASLSLITSTIDEGPARVRALGIYGVVISAAFFVGVAGGGALVDLLGWRAVMFVNVPLGVLAVVLAPRVIPESRESGPKRPLDVPGALAITAALLTLIYGLTRAGVDGWLSRQTLATLGLAACLGAVAYVLERRARVPLIAAALLRRRVMASAAAAAVLTAGAGVGVLFVFTLYLQEVLGLSAFATGLALTPFGITGVVSGVVSPRLAGRFGLVPVLSTVLAVQALGILVAVPIGSETGLGVVLVGAAIMGFGHFGATVLFTTLAATGVQPQDQGVTAGMVASSQEIGAGLGLAIIVAVATATTAAGGGAAAVVTGFRWALGTSAFMSILAAVVVWAVARRAPGR